MSLLVPSKKFNLFMMVCIPYKSKFFATKREYSNARENIKDATSSENRVQAQAS